MPAEIREACERIEREQAEEERRESITAIAKNIQREQGARFAEPLRIPETKPINLTMEINVVIIPARKDGE